jgi:hypothetical protein
VAESETTMNVALPLSRMRKLAPVLGKLGDIRERTHAVRFDAVV